MVLTQGDTEIEYFKPYLGDAKYFTEKEYEFGFIRIKRGNEELVMQFGGSSPMAYNGKRIMELPEYRFYKSRIQDALVALLFEDAYMIKANQSGQNENGTVIYSIPKKDIYANLTAVKLNGTSKYVIEGIDYTADDYKLYMSSYHDDKKQASEENNNFTYYNQSKITNKDVLNKVTELLKSVNIPNKANVKYTYEEVADVFGTAEPSADEDWLIVCGNNNIQVMSKTFDSNAILILNDTTTYVINVAYGRESLFARPTGKQEGIGATLGRFTNEQIEILTIYASWIRHETVLKRGFAANNNPRFGQSLFVVGISQAFSDDEFMAVPEVSDKSFETLKELLYNCYLEVNKY